MNQQKVWFITHGLDVPVTLGFIYCVKDRIVSGTLYNQPFFRNKCKYLLSMDNTQCNRTLLETKTPLT